MYRICSPFRLFTSAAPLLIVGSTQLLLTPAPGRHFLMMHQQHPARQALSDDASAAQHSLLLGEPGLITIWAGIITSRPYYSMGLMLMRLIHLRLLVYPVALSIPGRHQSKQQHILLFNNNRSIEISRYIAIAYSINNKAS